MEALRFFILYDNIFLLSIKIYPDDGYKIRNKQFINVDFPAPVRPTIPTLSPFYILILIFLITKGNPSLYLEQ
jgi:hypothetical protein